MNIHAKFNKGSFRVEKLPRELALQVFKGNQWCNLNVLSVSPYTAHGEATVRAELQKQMDRWWHNSHLFSDCSFRIVP